MIKRKRIDATDLATNVFTDGGGSIQLQQHVGLQQVLGPVHLKVGHGGGQPHPLMLDVEHHGLLVQLVCDEVDAPQSGVLVAGVEALEAVGDAELSAVLCEGVRVVGAAAHGPVPVSDQSVCHLDNIDVGSNSPTPCLLPTRYTVPELHNFLEKILKCV